MPSQAIEPTDSESTANGRSELLLVCEARSTTLTDGYWRFALETADGVPVLDAEDIESGDLNRLTLLAAVRGLESIEGPSCVTLLSNNRYLIRSLSDSLPRWRQNDFVWEHFGRRIDVQHADLWRRVDRALQIHRVEACLVSSRLVSNGQTPENAIGHAPQSGVITRVDSAHSDSSSSSIVPPPKSRQRGSSPDDRLRNWLLSSSRSRGNAPVQRRFTSKDLVETA
jgi:ribonuclease HI